MAAPFRLEFLLRLYQALERREELRLAEISAQLHAARDAVTDNLNKKNGLHLQLEASVEAGVPGAELRFRLLWADRLVERGGVLRQKVDEIVPLQTAQREQLLAACRRREALELVRRRQLEAEQREENRREQARQDEIFLMRQQRLALELPRGGQGFPIDGEPHRREE